MIVGSAPNRNEIGTPVGVEVGGNELVDGISAENGSEGSAKGECSVAIPGVSVDDGSATGSSSGQDGQIHFPVAIAIDRDAPIGGTGNHLAVDERAVAIA